MPTRRLSSILNHSMDAHLDLVTWDKCMVLSATRATEGLRAAHDVFAACFFDLLVRTRSEDNDIVSTHASKKLLRRERASTDGLTRNRRTN